MWALAFLTLALVCPSDSTERRADLDRAVAGYARPLDLPWSPTESPVAWIDVSGDGHEDALVLLQGRDGCAPGGCTLLVAEAMTDPEEATEWGPFRIAAEVREVTPPVHVTRSRGGWCDLIAADGLGAARVLRFDGETYPFHPSDGPLLGAEPTGVTLFADAP